MTRRILRSLPTLAVVLATTSALAQTNNIAVNNDGRNPDASAILDVSSNYLPLGSAIQKGMLIPRMTMAQRTALGAPGTLAQGLTVYITDVAPPGVAGFYYVEYGQWFKIDFGGNNWDILGNDIGTPANDYFGTRDDQDLVFRANNAQVMRVDGTPGARYITIGTSVGAPAEQLDVSGTGGANAAMRIYTPSPGPYSNTFTQGTILFRPPGTGSPGDTLFATYNPPIPQNRDAIMWAGHWGNIDGTNSTNPGVTDDGNSGGWRKLENDYTERFAKPYTQQGNVTCGATPAVIPGGATLYTNGLASPQGLDITPFKHDVANRRYRMQYLFLQNELNVESAQLGGNVAATGGLCAGQPVNQIGFYVNQAIAAGNQRNYQYVLTVKHVAFGVNNLTLDFDNSTDPAAGCAWSNALVLPAIGPAGWRTFNLTTPFVWDGLRNVVVELAVNFAVGVTPTVQGLPVLYTAAPPNTTRFAYAVPVYGGACAPATGIGNCNPGAVITNIGALCGTNGVSSNRPAIQWGGTVANAPAATSGTNSFIYYVGGLVVENTTSPAPWGRQTSPYFSFKGPGTISVQSGVYDNGVLLNDHVFDRAFDGAVKPQDAALFGNGRNVSIDEMSTFTRTNRHLPTMKGRDSWRSEGGFALGDLTNQLWTTTETQALYLTDLHDQLNVIELLSNDRPIDAEELKLARTAVCAMQGYTEADKALLLRTLEQRTVTTNQR